MGGWSIGLATEVVMALTGVLGSVMAVSHVRYTHSYLTQIAFLQASFLSDSCSLQCTSL